MPNNPMYEFMFDYRMPDGSRHIRPITDFGFAWNDPIAAQNWLSDDDCPFASGILADVSPEDAYDIQRCYECQ